MVRFSGDRPGASHDEPKAVYTAAATLVEHLAREDAFQHEVEHLEILETHISWVILTGTYAYKIKKPLDLGFLDFSTLKLRKHFCDEELRLNQRFAPDIYVAVVPIGGSPEQPVVGLEPALEWAVRMHEFSADARLDRQLSQNLVSAVDMHGLGASVAQIHDHAPVAPPDGPFGTIDAICNPTLDNFQSLIRDCSGQDLQQQLAALSQWTATEIDRLASVFQERLENGRIRECHGDLHLANLVRINDRIMAFDCLEFSAALRWIDVISEISFLVMDILVHERSDLAYAFLNRYLAVSGDYSGIELLRFYLIYRCLVRAKVNAVRYKQSPESSGLAAVTRYLDLATRLSQPDEEPILIITHGLSGSGKTWLTDRLMVQLPAIRLRSDLERKRLHGLIDLQSSDSEVAAGIYDNSATANTYNHLAHMAETCLSAGFNTIVDAAFLQTEQRAMFLSVAENLHVPLAILDCHAGDATLRHRISERGVGGTDASEADLDVLTYQLTTAQPFVAREQGHVIHVDSEQEINMQTLIRQVRLRQSAGY